MHLQRADSAYLARITKKFNPDDPPSQQGFWRLHLQGIEPPGDSTPVTLHQLAQAFIVRGVWRVQCPFGCNQSQFADPESQTKFVCTDCGNADAGFHWIGIEWPADRDEIEQALLARANPMRMHWYPHEAPEHLHAENVQHGVHDLRSVPKHRRTLVKFLVDASHEVEPAHVVAQGTIVHPDSEWFPVYHAAVAKTLGKNVSESDIRRALFVAARGR